MAKIKNIELNNFRNFTHNDFIFDDKLNILFGDNGSGKTNILEAISLIAKGTGIRNAKISNLIKNKQENFLIKNNLHIKNDNFNIEIYPEKKNNKFRKIIKVNDDASRESLEILNQSISYLTFIPEMERIFQSSPSNRRNFLDRLIFSNNNNYNKVINKYKKFILERVKILQNQNFDHDWLDFVENEISKVGLEIYQSRSFQLKRINENIKEMNKEKKFQFNVELKIKDDFFVPELTLEKYILDLKNTRLFDRQYLGTKIGPHRSDISAKINNDYEASLLSTGQQKTIVLITLLAQCSYLVNVKNKTPIILFDEIGSHLDSFNREILLDMINMFDIQFFLTGTEKSLFSFVSTNAKFYNITNV